MEDEISEFRSSKVLVTGVTPKVSRDKLFAHFQNSSKSGGGEIKSLIYPILRDGRPAAVVEYDKEDTARSVLQHQQRITSRNIPLGVSEYKPGLFESTTIELNTCVFEDPEVYNRVTQLANEVGVLKQEGTEAKICGEWDQILYVYQKLCNEQVNGDVSGQEQSSLSNEDVAMMNVNEAENLPDKRISQNGVNRNVRKSNDATAEVDPRLIGDQGGDMQQSNRVVLDKDIFAYVQLTRKEELEDILYGYRARTEYLDDSIAVELQSDIDEEGISRLQKIYQDAMENSVQENCDLPSGYDSSSVYKLIAQVRKQHPLIQMSFLRESNKVLFIGATKNACDNAINDFKYISKPSAEDHRANASSSRLSQYHPSDSTGRLLHHDFPGTGLVVNIHKGDIAKQTTEAIVNAANRDLHDGAGVTGAIFGAGGERFRQSCRRLIAGRGKLSVGEVVHTEADGKLRCRYVLHVVAPKWDEFPHNIRKDRCQEIMNKLCWKLVKYANCDLKVSSVAIPAIGTGIYGIPIPVFCEAMLCSIRKFQKYLMEKSMKAYLKEIRLVNYDSVEAAQLVSYMDGELSRDFSGTSV